MGVDGVRGAGAESGRWPAWVGVMTVTGGAFLLFLVQPLAGRFVLPWFGGGPAVWTVAMLFFQGMLLAGYGYADLVGGRLSGQRAAWVHGGVLVASLAVLPLAPDVGWKPAGAADPTLRILGLLAETVGLPFLALAATGPLVQAWWARLAGRSPYRLYAWSNAGSLAALLLYPLVLEPLAGVRWLARAWSVAYLVFVAGSLALAWRVRGLPAVARGEVAGGLRAGEVGSWVEWAACGSALLLAITDAISQDLSVTPLLWVLPLAVYLATWILCFAQPRWASRAVFGPLLGVASVVLVALLHRGWRLTWGLQLGGYVAVLFVFCMICHGELVRRRPPPRQLTRFYLAIAAGGALGGLLVGVAAPLLLPMHLELHLATLATWGLFGLALRRDRPSFAPRGALPVALFVLFVLGVGEGLRRHAVARIRGAAEVARSFFGVLQVKEYAADDPERHIVHLLDGRISHGFQRVAAPREPTAYFVRESGIGLALGHLMAEGAPPRHVGVLGLGVGTLAAYGRPGDRLRFYEINPDVIRVARERFSFLRDSPATITVVPGDGRLALEREPPQGFDLLVLDAFSGDAIPTHLLTAEAFDVYDRHLRPGGFVAVNVSNNHVDAARVVRALAARGGLSVIRVRHRARSILGPYLSDWMLLSRDRERLAGPPFAGRTSPLGDGPPVLWTDDHAPLLPILRR